MMTKNVLLLLVVLLVIPSTIIHPFPTDSRLQGFLGCLSNLTSLTASSSDSLFTPDEPSYYDALHSSIRNRRFETATTHQPMVVVQPRDVSEIGPVVVCARAHDFQLRVRSGGHDYEGMSYVSAALPFVVLDLQKLSEVTVDPAARTAWIQSGATIGQVYYHVGRSSGTLAFPAGVSPTVGVGGHFSGGGYGFLLRYAGLAADHVIDVVVVDAEGRIRDRKSIGEDVFWAIRGGGGNTFGVVAAWKVELVTVPEAVTVGSVMKGIELDATQCLLKWQEIAHTLPDELFLRVVVFRQNNSTSTTLEVVFNIFYVGSAGQAISLLQERFPELGVTQLSEIGWAESTVYFADFKDLSVEQLLSRTPRTPRQYFKGKSDYVTQSIPQSGLEGIWKKMLREDIEETYLLLTPYGGLMSRIPETSIPFPHRKGNMFMIQYIVYWNQDGEEEADRHLRWMRDVYEYMTPYVSSNPRAAYANYRDIDIGENYPRGATTYERAKIWGVKYFKGNFERLVAIKTAFDPNNVFCNEQSVPPLHPNQEGHRKKSGAPERYRWSGWFFMFVLALYI
ncbi:Tetrahydroberberine oxidase [Linum grandiflorum]